MDKNSPRHPNRYNNRHAKNAISEEQLCQQKVLFHVQLSALTRIVRYQAPFLDLHLEHCRSNLHNNYYSVPPSSPSLPRPHTHTHTRTQTYTHTRTHTHTCTYTLTHTHTRTQTDTHTHTHTHTHIHTHTHTRTHTHTHYHTLTHTH